MTLALGLSAVVTVGAFAWWTIRQVGRGREMPDPGCLRCTPCGASWPNGTDYQPCPECLQPTSQVTDAAMDAADAHSRMTHARFDRWLAEHGRLHQVEQLERIPVREKAE